jgi:hypothetical protein
MVEFMHNINITTFPDEILRTNKQTGQIVPLRNIVGGPIEPSVHNWSRGLYQTMALQKHLYVRSKRHLDTALDRPASSYLPTNDLVTLIWNVSRLKNSLLKGF